MVDIEIVLRTIGQVLFPPKSAQITDGYSLRLSKKSEVMDATILGIKFLREVPSKHYSKALKAVFLLLLGPGMLMTDSM